MAASPMPLSTRTAPFDSVADTYDDTFTNSLIGRAQREAVWLELDRCFHPGQRVLELNCGTGVDAIHLGERGVEVLACDIAARMIEVARRRLNVSNLSAPVHFRVLATEDIAQLDGRGRFDGVFSNFAGLNCVENLSSVAADWAQLLKPGARALVCVAGLVVAWELVWYLAQGNLGKALRRFHHDGIRARLADGAHVMVYYPSVRAVARMLRPEFRLIAWKGVGLTVPPSYLEQQARRHPKMLKACISADRALSRLPLLRGLADHRLLEFERVAA